MNYKTAFTTARHKAKLIRDNVYIVLDYADESGPVFDVATDNDLTTWASNMPDVAMIDSDGYLVRSSI